MSIPRTRRQRQLLDESIWFLPDAEVARVCSFLPVRPLVTGCALVSKRWRQIIATNALAWRTAIRDLDPCARLGPQAAIAAAAKLCQRGGGWLDLAARLGSSLCYRNGCDAVGLRWDPNLLKRSCARHARAGSDFVLSYFTYSRQPWCMVDTAEDLKAALEDAPFGSCICIPAGTEIFYEDTLVVRGRRLIGNRCCCDDIKHPPPMIHCNSTIVCDMAILENLRLRVGDEEEYYCDCGACEMPDMQFYPAVCAIRDSDMIIRDCKVTSLQGTTLMAEGCRIAAENCHLSSNYMCLGVVVQPWAREADGPPLAGLVSVHGCTFVDHMWGASLGRDATPQLERAFLSANVFRNCAEAKLTRQYEDTKQGAQPWRRGWTQMD
eukprot:TRINITY_DN10847_c0_g1_i1.p1 TRINITY_DN10847_c0_g1~~TRINITY_DN10847_c0_g1_i1.p1  ORF type:complete len:379 (-),score=80.63 TRINITY_DN10847_c0_g1_i1:732-1868(-)